MASHSRAPRNYVGQFSVQILEADKILGYLLSFYVNRIERTHFIILAEPSPKKNTLISILSILDLMLFNPESIYSRWG